LLLFLSYFFFRFFVLCPIYRVFKKPKFFFNGSNPNGGQQFRDDFEICDVVLGKGGQGEVRLAWNVRTKEQLVVKIVDLAKMLEVRGPGGINWINRTRLEAEVLGKLDHVSCLFSCPTFLSFLSPNSQSASLVLGRANDKMLS